MKKTRRPVPPPVAAEVLFAANRTCCVCRDATNAVQVHHIDEDPSNNDLSNLAVLCLPCHDKTQITGGFGRKLDAYQVRLYKHDWDAQVRHFRLIGPDPIHTRDAAPGLDLKLATTLPEIFKERGDLESLIDFYHSVGNVELRDRFIEQLLRDNTDASVVIWAARLQGRLHDISSEVFDAALSNVTDDYMVESGLLTVAGRPLEAAKAFVGGILYRLEAGDLFNAVYNMKRLSEEPFVNELLKLELTARMSKDDLWWQLRCLQELGWTTEVRALLMANEARILASKDLLLRRELARVTQNSEDLFAVEKLIAEAGIAAYIRSSEIEEVDG